MHRLLGQAHLKISLKRLCRLNVDASFAEQALFKNSFTLGSNIGALVEGSFFLADKIDVQQFQPYSTGLRKMELVIFTGNKWKLGYFERWRPDTSQGQQLMK